MKPIFLLPLVYCFTFLSLIAQNRALFFAVDDYSNNREFSNLRNPIGDAEAIAKELREMYGFETVIYKNPTTDKIFSVLESWQKESFNKDEQLFVFFSGHGTFWEEASKGYFVPYGSQTGYRNYIELTTLGNIITKIKSEHILLAIDACYSGTIDQEVAFRGPDFYRPNENDQTKRNNIVSVQLRNNSRLLITSGGKERTPDGDDHSPFAGAILSGLRKTYTSGDGLFLFSDLEAQLERVSPLPHKGVLKGHQDGGFVFQSTASGIVNKATPSKPAQTDFRPQKTNNPPTISAAASFTDRDGNRYGFKSMKDGKQWMTKNLNVNITGSYCYDDKSENCGKYGRLYTWEAAKKGCANLGGGWRLPNYAEWEKLRESYGGQKASYTSLLNNGGSGFSAQLGGWRSSDGDYDSLGEYGGYWSSAKSSGILAWTFYFDSDYGRLNRDDFYRTNAQSVRCVKD